MILSGSVDSVKRMRHVSYVTIVISTLVTMDMMFFSTTPQREAAAIVAITMLGRLNLK